MPDFGFIGPGIMWRPMCLNLLKPKHNLSSLTAPRNRSLRENRDAGVPQPNRAAVAKYSKRLDCLYTTVNVG
jgi:3-hydroxyisobutyrate dehydrogenase-like beta-hydroxyacid dehydrogenase